jgi:putative pyruvate formate lyase activating enzyme
MLDAYRSVAERRALPAFIGSGNRRVGATALAGLDLKELWDLHDQVSAPGADPSAGSSLLDLKTELAWRTMRECALCERRCHIDRTRGESGFCGAGPEGPIVFEQILWGEEAPLVPSHFVFFAGCNMRCAFCYAAEPIRNPGAGGKADPDRLAGLIESRYREGAANVTFIGGEPTVHLPVVLRTLQRVRNPIAVGWNSNFYMSEESMRLLEGVIDIHVADFRFGNDECASRIGGTTRYVAAATRNIQLAAESTDLIIRHLVMPGHLECCLRPVGEWVRAHLPLTPFSLMLQYLPFHAARNDPVLGRPLSDQEADRARSIVDGLGLNTADWNVPLRRTGSGAAAGRGALSTTVEIRPDGRVALVHQHRELLRLARELGEGGDK